MGIAELWPILPLDERVPFPIFLARFLRKHGRPPRLAIDAYMFMFWALLPNTDQPDPTKEPRDIRNSMAKLWYLVQNNVSFVVVLDGKCKPDKLRHGHIPELSGSRSYDEVLRSFLRVYTLDYSEGLRMIESLKKMLSRNRMDWVQAPGEAEAECAWLQRLGVVDYVVSNDSDTMVFGATCVLRWFNRVKYYNEQNEPIKSSTDYYVTPVHMRNVTEQTSLTRNHLVMIAVLRGGDYSTGADSIGITRAKELAFCGTSMLLNSPRKTQQDFGEFPDLTSIFVNTFLDTQQYNVILPDPFHGMKLELDRAESLVAFNVFFNEFLLQNGRRVFGRSTTIKNKVKIDDYYAMLYFFPFVNTRIFKFSPHSITFAEVNHVENDLLSVNIDCEVLRTNLLLGPKPIGKLVITNGVLRFEPRVDMNNIKITLPRERKKSLKAFVLKFLREKKFWGLINFHRIKLFEGELMAVLNFDRINLNEFVYHLRYNIDVDGEISENGSEEDTHKLNEESVEAANEPKADRTEEMITVPFESISFVSEEYLKLFQKKAKQLSPTKKRHEPQKTTLDCLMPSLLPLRKKAPKEQSELSPTHTKKSAAKANNKNSSDGPSLPTDQIEKKEEVIGASHLSTETAKAFKNEMFPSSNTSPKKYRRQRKGQKTELLPGQSTITSFVISRRGGKSMEDPLHILSDDEDDKRENPFRSMTNSLKCGPNLFAPGPQDKDRPLSLPEVSPTKRHRRFMELSAESSPIKGKPELKAFW